MTIIMIMGLFHLIIELTDNGPGLIGPSDNIEFKLPHFCSLHNNVRNM